uniref:Uncharacterized protein n=1 Tax=Romanomermis culicivorax TaxID=13658 RepID=A0A915I6R5_ROMCU
MKKWLENKKNSEKPYVQKIDSLAFPRLVTKLEKVFKMNQKIRKEQRIKRAVKLSNVVKIKQIHQKPKIDVSNNCEIFNGKTSDSLMKLAFASVIQRENDKLECSMSGKVSVTAEISPSDKGRNDEFIPPLKLNLCADNGEISTVDRSKENNEASRPKDNLKITLSFKSKEKYDQKRKCSKNSEEKSSNKTKSSAKDISKKQLGTARLNKNHSKKDDFKIDTLEEESATDLKNTERLNSIFAVSKNGRVPRVNRNIDIDLAVFDDAGNYKEYAYQNNLDDEEDEDFSDEDLLKLKIPKSKLGAPYLHLLTKSKRKFHDVDQRKNIEYVPKNEDDANGES